MPLHPYPQRCKFRSRTYQLGEQVSVYIQSESSLQDTTVWSMLVEDVKHLIGGNVVATESADDADIRLCLSPHNSTTGPTLPAEGYTLNVSETGILIFAQDEAGLFYGVQTLIQLIADNRKAAAVQFADILDWPGHAMRSVMLDMSRCIYSMPLLRRMVRIAARLKLNTLHLHLHDNEMNSVRYEGMPLGSENPYAIPIGDFVEFMVYAKQYHVEVIPELESWGHAGSILQHYPHLYGATRPFGYGHAFAVGPEMFELLEQMFGQWAAILPDGAKFHVGMDEANWCLAKGADPAVYNHDTLVSHVYQTVNRAAAKHSKKLKTMMWGGGPKHPDSFVPPEIRDDIIMAPWTYRTKESVHEQILRHWVRDTKRYNEQGEMRNPFVMGGGSVGIHEFGVVEATLQWALRGLEYPNCLGLIMTCWASNNVHDRLMNIYFGAACAWSPHEAERQLHRDMALDHSYEEGVGLISRDMREWQGIFPDVGPEAINKDRGPEVVMGKWRYGDKHGEEVLPIWMPENMRKGDQN